ncbi:MAG: hypothetical protein Q8O49_01560 [bacterium]|nr:hypothetical protein [bacterium]
MKLKSFVYKFDAGPFEKKEGLARDWKIGNCRRSLQYYFFEVHGIFLKPEEVLCPAAYHRTGSFVFEKGQDIDFRSLKEGDIIYAERIKDKKGNLVEVGESKFANFEDYITSLHTAIYTGKLRKEIWHATSVEGKDCFWSLSKFLGFYKLIAVKRVLAN